jgi:hypothetical protein
LVRRSLGLAEELLEKLNKAKAQGRFRKWKSLRQAVKSVWCKKGVDEMAQTLKSFRDEIQTHLFMSVMYVHNVFLRLSILQLHWWLTV